MNIVHFSDTYYPLLNGVSVAVEQFAAKASLDKNNKVLVIVPSYSLRSSIEVRGNLTIRKIRSIPFPIYPGIHAAFPNQVALFRIIKDFSPDIIHIHTPFILGILGTVFSQMLHVHLVNTYHTLFSQSAVYLSPKRLFPRTKLTNVDSKQSEQGILSLIIWRLQIIFFNISDAVIAPTQVIANTLKKQGIKSEIKVLPSGLDIMKFTQKTEYKQTLRILHLGRLGLEKSTDVILKAFQLVLQKIPKATLLIAGDGPAKRKLERLAKELGIAKNVNFLGMVSNDKASEVYKSCDIFTTASTFETQGLVLLEAMLSGLPVVAAGVNAPLELIENDKNGYLFSEGNYKECAERLIGLLNDPELCEKLGRNARIFGESFDSNKTSSKLIAYYKKILSTRPW